MNFFAQRLRGLRDTRGLSQEQLADKLGIPRTSITHYETDSNNRLPRRERLEQIADFFGCTVDYLLGRDSPMLTGSDHGVDLLRNGPEDHMTSVTEEVIPPEERSFLEWVKDNIEGSFFYDFDKSPEDSKREMMRSLRIIWELEKNRRPGQRQGD